MSVEEELLQIARERDAATEIALAELMLEPPDLLRRQFRVYLSRQVDYGRIRRTNERIPQLITVQGGLNELSCPELEFSSGVRLGFNIRLEEQQRGWLVKQFKFSVLLPERRGIRTVQIHLNAAGSHDSLNVPRCHMHIGNSRAHVPFPVMNPRLILHLICEHIEPDVGS
jgi:hypothetical protein